MSLAVKRTRSTAWSGNRSGLMSRTQAIAAVTIGAEKLVPDCSSQPSLVPSSSNAGGTAVVMPTPGAARSSAALRFENDAGFRLDVSAATVTPGGREAGNSTGLPSPASLPAAATGTEPAATANWIATYSS